MSENPFTAKWSAQGHTLCLGHWIIHYQGLPLVLPSDKAEKDMDTYGNFSYLFPDEDDFIEGTPEVQWIEENIDWLMEVFERHGIPVDEANLCWFYRAVNAADWRCGSCGGCI